MKITTFNVNGLQSALSKGLGKWIESSSCDVFCLQEIRHQSPEDLISFFQALGFNWHFNKSYKKGYAGVGILSKTEFHFELYPNNNLTFDGRLVQIKNHKLRIATIYAPAGGEDPINDKLAWWIHFLQFLRLESIPDILCGDYNICHLPIDNAQLIGDQKEFFHNSLSIIITALHDLGYVDSFRTINQEPHHYTWLGHLERTAKRRVGRRIDYISTRLDWKDLIERCFILQHAQLSDHRPVFMDIKL